MDRKIKADLAREKMIMKDVEGWQFEERTFAQRWMAPGPGN